MYRLFVAVDMPHDLQERLGNMFFGIPGAKWVAEEQLHLTLRFIGEVDGGVFDDIREALGEIKADSFTMQLKGMGYFPPRKSPNVLWVGIEKNEKLTILRNRIEAVVVKTGLLPEQRKFSPHITLARLQGTPLLKITNFLAGNSLFESEPFQVSEFHLYSSLLTSKGAIHQIEATYPLSK
jgi:2'-5' RNA ligase